MTSNLARGPTRAGRRQDNKPSIELSIKLDFSSHTSNKPILFTSPHQTTLTVSLNNEASPSRTKQQTDLYPTDTPTKRKLQLPNATPSPPPCLTAFPLQPNTYIQHVRTKRRPSIPRARAPIRGSDRQDLKPQPAGRRPVGRAEPRGVQVDPLQPQQQPRGPSRQGRRGEDVQEQVKNRAFLPLTKHAHPTTMMLQWDFRINRNPLLNLFFSSVHVLLAPPFFGGVGRRLDTYVDMK